MLYVIYKLFIIKKRKEYFNINFNTKEYIYDVRLNIDVVSKIIFRERWYYLVYKKYYVLVEDNEIDTLKKVLIS